MSMIAVFPILFILLFYGVIAAGIIYVVVTVLKNMKERNEYLKDIRDELRKKNDLFGETVQFPKEIKPQD